MVARLSIDRDGAGWLVDAKRRPSLLDRRRWVRIAVGRHRRELTVIDGLVRAGVRAGRRSARLEELVVHQALDARVAVAARGRHHERRLDVHVLLAVLGAGVAVLLRLLLLGRRLGLLLLLLGRLAVVEARALVDAVLVTRWRRLRLRLVTAVLHATVGLVTAAILVRVVHALSLRVGLVTVLVAVVAVLLVAVLLPLHGFVLHAVLRKVVLGLEITAYTKILFTIFRTQ